MNRYRRTKRNAKIVTLYKDGIDVTTIAETFKVSHRLVYYILAHTLTDDAETKHRIAQQPILERDLRAKEGR